MANSRPLIDHRIEDGVDVLYLNGVWRLANIVPITAALQRVRLAHGARCVLDGGQLEAMDTAAGFQLFRHLAAGGCSEATIGTRAFEPRHERLLALVRERMECPPAMGRTRHPGLVQHLGYAAVALGRTLVTHSAFVGVVTLELLRLLRRPRLFRFKETVSQFETICLDAIPIVALVTFLIGVVFAYILGQQAQRYGANIFVVDGVGLAICRELAPLLVAVIVAGRSGAAFTAQIGTMKVQDEIDAISTLGLSPIQVLVIPRLVAIVIALPLLVLVGDIMGISGGMLVSAWQLDIYASNFLDRLHTVLPMSAPVVGLAKAPVFAAFIALIACRMGMLVARDARSVGLNTTSTVVQSIVWVIVLDALFAVVLQRLGI
ncbi:MAG TPA: ABC transporter permease [Burkholderiales bacterium]|nr:ABC transporter permease [Burkholderiales bacterium]